MDAEALCRSPPNQNQNQPNQTKKLNQNKIKSFVISVFTMIWETESQDSGKEWNKELPGIVQVWYTNWGSLELRKFLKNKL